MSSRHIILSGDAPVQLFLLPVYSSNNIVASTQRRRVYRTRGGVGILVDLLKGLGQSTPNVKVHKPSLPISVQDAIQSVVELGVHRDSALLDLKSKQLLHADPIWHAPDIPLPDADDDNVSVWVLQDAQSESSFRDSDSEKAINMFNDSRPQFLVYHMSLPLCVGKLWETLRHGPYTKPNKRDPERVVVIVSADDLRAEGIELSYGLSWEKTCEDFVEQLGSLGKLVTLATCAHLIVLFGCDGVIYHRGLQAAKPTLFFDPICIEGEFFRRNLGSLPGVMEVFVAGFVKGFVQCDCSSFEEGIESGLWAARRLSSHGLAVDSETSQTTIYQPSILMHELCPVNDGPILRLSIPADEIASGSEHNWSLFDHMIGDPAEVARLIVKEGFDSLANRVPLKRFNRLILFDRQEIEAFRTLFTFVMEYSSAPQSKPLNIVLCGPKSSGKSFAALHVVQSALAGQRVRQMRFDLAELTHADELLAAFHSVRDCALEGYIPLVYFSGFDLNYPGTPQLGWIPYLLPVVLHGRFSDHGVSRPLGSAIFFFGATLFKNYNELRRRADADVSNSSRLSDFLGCLHGFVNVLGPDRLDSGDGIDRLYPVRRAVILRALLEERESNLKSGELIDIDDSVLNGLLLVPTYRHGIASLKSIIAMSRLNNARSFERAALPPPAQLDLHVEYDTFTQYMGGLPIPDRVREELAEKLHNVYLQAKQKITPPEDPTPWNELGQELKESTRAHADSIPGKLSRISCFLSERQEYRDPVQAFTPDQIEILAEVEHDRWNSERLQNQWHMGERDLTKRKTPFLIPWADLEWKWQEIDRAMVASYPTILKPYEIYKMGPEVIGG